MQALTVITKHTATPQHLLFLFFHLLIWRLLLNFAAKITSMKIVKGKFKEKLELVFAPSIKAGFPSPAEDYIVESLDFNRDLIKHPEATFYAHVDGDSMIGIGIEEGDIAVVDKSLEPQQGVQYKRGGVIVMGISPSRPIQQDLFDLNAEQIEKMNRLDKVIDRINKRYGSETIVIGAQQYTQKDGKGKAEVFANAIKHDFKSKNPTTRWSDIIRLK